MLKYRLTLGSVLILAIAFFAWLDEWFDRLPTPGWIPYHRETLPPGVVAFLVLGLLSAMGAREVARILRAKGDPVGTGFAIVTALVGLCWVGLMPFEISGGVGLAVGVSSVAIVFVSGLLYAIRNREIDGAIRVGSGVLLIHVYMGLMLGFLILIRREYPIWMLIWVLACVKSCDIGAFFTGTAIGKHKLIPWLSPGKTWEGLVGGMLTSALVGGVGAWLLLRSGVDHPGVIAGAVMGFVFGGLGQMGDLAASLMKRDARVKDSGTSLPGFGGVLDIIDSPVFVAPFAFWSLRLAEIFVSSGG
ncbi:MAG: phosphatidate cytidylyltransferase [Phycisphaerales bacterium]|nr:phosphatidate cytidylyltransferase [Phycisphaerales bacterium]